MPDYLLAYHPGKMPGSPEEGTRLRAAWQTWVAGLGDAMVNPGVPLGTSWTVSADGASEGGGANPLMGFSVIRAADLSAALAIAQGCPHLAIGTIEVAEMKRM